MDTMIKIQKWDNELGINIPPVIANGLSLKEGLYVSIKENRSRIIIEPPNANASYNLADMLNEITEDNIHHCIETGIPAGNEIW
jgi:antitoxin component of MazEF toxin-antitoxin module